MGTTSRDTESRQDERTGTPPRTDGLANALAWFSIGLGLAQIAAPRGVARFIGVDDDDRTTALMRTLGVRELASGIGILSQPRVPGWMWGRVAGDVMDLALLGSALNARGAQRTRVTAATAAVLGVTALDVLAGQRLTRESEGPSGQKARGVHVKKAITIGKSPEEVYDFWHDFENLPRFMRHLESVQVLDDRRSHWKAKAPTGKSVEWDAEITEDRPNELIAWRSVEGADVENSGSVHFRPAPGDRGTEVTVELRYDPPGGVVAAQLAKLFHEEPGQQVEDDLHQLKQVLEIGEVMLSDATVRPGPHAARPSREPVEI